MASGTALGIVALTLFVISLMFACFAHSKYDWEVQDQFHGGLWKLCESKGDGNCYNYGNFAKEESDPSATAERADDNSEADGASGGGNEVEVVRVDFNAGGNDEKETDAADGADGGTEDKEENNYNNAGGNDGTNGNGGTDKDSGTEEKDANGGNNNNAIDWSRVETKRTRRDIEEVKADEVRPSKIAPDRDYSLYLNDEELTKLEVARDFFVLDLIISLPLLCALIALLIITKRWLLIFTTLLSFVHFVFLLLAVAVMTAQFNQLRLYVKEPSPGAVFVELDPDLIWGSVLPWIGCAISLAVVVVLIILMRVRAEDEEKSFDVNKQNTDENQV